MYTQRFALELALRQDWKVLWKSLSIWVNCSRQLPQTGLLLYLSIVANQYYIAQKKKILTQILREILVVLREITVFSSK